MLSVDPQQQESVFWILKVHGYQIVALTDDSLLISPRYKSKKQAVAAVEAASQSQHHPAVTFGPSAEIIPLGGIVSAHERQGRGYLDLELENEVLRLSGWKYNPSYSTEGHPRRPFRFEGNVLSEAYHEIQAALGMDRVEAETVLQDLANTAIGSGLSSSFEARPRTMLLNWAITIAFGVAIAAYGAFALASGFDQVRGVVLLLFGLFGVVANRRPPGPLIVDAEGIRMDSAARSVAWDQVSDRWQTTPRKGLFGRTGLAILWTPGFADLAQHAAGHDKLEALVAQAGQRAVRPVQIDLPVVRQLTRPQRDELLNVVRLYQPAFRIEEPAPRRRGPQRGKTVRSLEIATQSRRSFWLVGLPLAIFGPLILIFGLLAALG